MSARTHDEQEPDPPEVRLTRSQQKVQRWVDLVAALLSRRWAVTFAELAKEVPAYSGFVGSKATRTADDSIKKTFERDKEELRAFGIHIESASKAGDADFLYRLQPKEFYLPYLAFASQQGTQHPPHVDQYGYQSLATLTFDPDELLAIAHGAARARALGDPLLAAEVNAAMRKLAFDLPLDAAAPDPAASLVAPRAVADPDTVATLGEALAARRRVRFTYHAMGSDVTSGRTVEPYGLSFVGGHWYLVGRDVERDALRNFRASRISALEVLGKPDEKKHQYAIPAGFSLREHSRSRQAWELGDGDAMEVEVEFTGSSGAARAAAELGMADPGRPAVRWFRVRRVDAFARWILSFAGEARVLAPETAVNEVRRIAGATLAVYGADEPVAGGAA